MEFPRLLNKDQIRLGVKVENKERLLEFMVDMIMESSFSDKNPDLGREDVLSAVRTREQRTSTGIGNGFAFPHARLPVCNGVGISMVTLKEPVEYEAPDEQPIYIACMMIGPENEPNLFLKVMSCLGQFFGDDKARDSLLAASSPEEAYRLLQEKGMSIDISVHAGQLMRPLLLHAHLDTPLKEVTYGMLSSRVEALPVLDENDHIAGELTCDDLFQYGVPDFFSQLRSVSFIREFDPVDKYFQKEARCVAGDLMHKEFATLTPDATLLEIIFLLAVKKHPKVYILDEKKRCIGAIDRIAVLDRVINI